MTTASSIYNTTGVQTYESAQQKDLYAEDSSQTMGKDTFLKLLTTQLQHQDPLNPMDNSQFVAQLSQFSSLEQLTNVNSSLTNLGVSMNSVGNTAMVNLIGKEVKAVGDGFHYESGNKTLHYSLADTAKNVQISVFNSDGDLVYSKSLEGVPAGDQTLIWDGKLANGGQAEAGDYTFKVAASTDGTTISSQTYTQGMVDQIDYTSGAACPRVDGQVVSAANVVQVIEGDEGDN